MLTEKQKQEIEKFVNRPNKIKHMTLPEFERYPTIGAYMQSLIEGFMTGHLAICELELNASEADLITAAFGNEGYGYYLKVVGSNVGVPG